MPGKVAQVVWNLNSVVSVGNYLDQKETMHQLYFEANRYLVPILM